MQGILRYYSTICDQELIKSGLGPGLGPLIKPVLMSVINLLINPLYISLVNLLGPFACPYTFCLLSFLLSVC